MELAGIRSRVGNLLTLARSDGLGRYRDEDLYGYVPAPYRALYTCMGQLPPLRPGTGVFLDYGVGMGRAAVVAARRPFARVVGIDLSPEMVERARQNVARARPKLRCEVEIVHAATRTYSVGPDVTVVHLFNPFAGQTLASVGEEIRRSLREHPRELTVIYGNPGAFEELVAGQGWVERRYFGEFYPATGYGVYRCRAPG